jgi:hypothetical protein
MCMQDVFECICHYLIYLGRGIYTLITHNGHISLSIVQK